MHYVRWTPPWGVLLFRVTLFWLSVEVKVPRDCNAKKYRDRDLLIPGTTGCIELVFDTPFNAEGRGLLGSAWGTPG